MSTALLAPTSPTSQNVQTCLRLALDAKRQVAAQNLRIQTIRSHHQSTRQDVEHLQSEYSNLQGKVEALQSGLKSILIDDFARNALERDAQYLQAHLTNIGKNITLLESEVAFKTSIQRLADEAMLVSKPQEISDIKKRIKRNIALARSDIFSAELIGFTLVSDSRLDARTAALQSKRHPKSKSAPSSRATLVASEASPSAHRPKLTPRVAPTRAPTPLTFRSEPTTSARPTPTGKALVPFKSKSSHPIRDLRPIKTSYSRSYASTYLESPRGSDTSSDTETEQSPEKATPEALSRSVNQVLSYVNTGLDVFDAAHIAAVGIISGPVAALPLIAYAAGSRLTGYVIGQTLSSVLTTNLSEEQLAFASRVSTVASIYSTVSRTGNAVSYFKDWASGEIPLTSYASHKDRDTDNDRGDGGHGHRGMRGGTNGKRRHLEGYWDHEDSKGRKSGGSVRIEKEPNGKPKVKGEVYIEIPY